MFSALRRRLTYTNVGVTLALFFSMSGGALAAGHYLITSTKQIKPSVLSALKGKAGPAGATGSAGVAGNAGAPGLQGPVGIKGETGPEGKEGKEGKAGKNGTNGTTGFTETLPEGKTETGTWSYGTARGVGTEEYAGYVAYVPISFNIPLEEALERTQVHFVGSGGTPSCLEPEEPGREECEKIDEEIKEVQAENEAACPGSAEAPAAEPGNLCVYLTNEQGGVLQGRIYNSAARSFPLNGGSAATGATLRVDAEVPGQLKSGGDGALEESENLSAYGTWAVTAPEKEK